MKYLSFFILFFLPVAYSQELNCKVTVNFDNLPVVNREILIGFANTVQDYLNNTRFTDKWEGEKIECTMSIFMLSAADEINYTAQVFIGSQRPVYRSIKNSPMLNLLDDSWSFSYEKNQALYSNRSVFDPLVSFLDFYAYIIIGYDLDSWEEFGGSEFFAKAFDIVNLGANSKYSKGWQSVGGSFSYSRRALVEDLLNEKYRTFREGFYDYHYGIDVFAQNPQVGQENIIKLIKALEVIKNKRDLNSVLVKVFFDAKSAEIIEHLKTYSDPDIFKVLSKIDPAHAAKYDEAYASLTN